MTELEKDAELALIKNLIKCIPQAMPMEPFQTIDRGSKNFKAGWNACRGAMIAAQYLQTVDKGLIVDERV